VEKFKVRQAKKSPVKKTVKKPKEAASEEK